MVHAENGDAIDVLVREALAGGEHRAALPRAHAPARARGRGDATARSQLARIAGSPLYVVHVTCKDAVDPIAAARAKGWDVWGETCTQYFFTDITDLDEPDFGGAKYVFSPPVREAWNQPVLWDAVRTDALSAISTDHCAFTLSGQKTLGKDDFSKIPNGAPGLEDRLRMIHHFGVNEGRIALNRMVELLATNPAKLFGLYPRKGTIAPGSDADLVVFDPTRKTTISAATQHSKSDYTLYEGTEVTGDVDADDDPRHGRRRGRRAEGRAGLRAVRAAREVRRAARLRRPSERATRAALRRRVWTEPLTRLGDRPPRRLGQPAESGQSSGISRR